jgi:hypothetical protein
MSGGIAAAARGCSGSSSSDNCWPGTAFLASGRRGCFGLRIQRAPPAGVRVRKAKHCFVRCAPLLTSPYRDGEKGSPPTLLNVFLDGAKVERGGKTEFVPVRFSAATTAGRLLPQRLALRIRPLLVSTPCCSPTGAAGRPHR